MRNFPDESRETLVTCEYKYNAQGKLLKAALKVQLIHQFLLLSVGSHFCLASLSLRPGLADGHRETTAASPICGQNQMNASLLGGES
jgi:hypothetical protein